MTATCMPWYRPRTDEAEVVTFASGLTLPSGLALIGADLYVGALDRVLRYRAIEKTYRDNPQPEIVTDQLPDERHHGWKYLCCRS